MRQHAKRLCGAVGLVLLCAAAHASFPDNLAHPYDVIASRNVFGLVAGPKPLLPEPVRTPLPKITLTGITTLLDRKLVLLKVQFPAKPGEQAHERSLLLTERERESGIEIMRIDPRAGRVVLNNSGSLTTLTFADDGIK